MIGCILGQPSPAPLPTIERTHLHCMPHLNTKTPGGKSPVYDLASVFLQECLTLILGKELYFFEDSNPSASSSTRPGVESHFQCKIRLLGEKSNNRKIHLLICVWRGRVILNPYLTWIKEFEKKFYL